MFSVLNIKEAYKFEGQEGFNKCGSHLLIVHYFCCLACYRQ